jgi:hypothetical protein
VNILAVGFVPQGKNVRMTGEERAAIRDPLARSIERLSASMKEAVHKYSDPVSVATGFAMWGYRVYQENQPPEGPPPPKPRRDVPPPAPGPAADKVKDNGHVTTVVEGPVPTPALPQDVIDQVNGLAPL